MKEDLIMYGLAMTDSSGNICYVEKLTKKNATTSKFKFDARRFFTPGEAAMACREALGKDTRIFSKYTKLGIFIVDLN